MLHPLPPVASQIRPAQDLSAGSSRSSSRISSPDREPRLRVERLWQEYFSDPSQWWDNRMSKTKPKAPDFRHKSTKESLWIDGWCNPDWVKDMLEQNVGQKGGIQDVNWVKSSSGHAGQEMACLNAKDHALAEELAQSNRIYQAKSRSGVQGDSSQPQELLDGRNWEMLSLEEALIILDRMVELPSIDTFICLLQKCRRKKKLVYAKRVHAHICNHKLESHRTLGNYIVPMFVECGSLSDAQEVFNRLVYRTEHSWTSLILGYIDCGESQRGLNLYHKMQNDSIYPSSYTLMALLKACAKLKDVERGREIHADIVHKGFERNVFVGNTLVDMYAKCGLLAEAQEVFNNLPARDVVSSNALIAGYAEYGPGQEALKCFEQMQRDGISPDAFTFVGVLKACANTGALQKGREIHTNVARKGFERDVFIGNTLVAMYAKCGSLIEAQQVLDKLPGRDVVSWTTLIAGYAENGLGQDALKCFERMQLDGVSPNAATYVNILKACGSIGAIVKGREIHADISQNGFERDLFVGNTLVDMYAKCGSLAEAQEVFDKLPVRDAVSWTALIAGYANHGPVQEALKCFEHMKVERISPDAPTLVCILKACSNMGAIDKGREIHTYIAQKGFERNVFVGSALVDMYANCGSLSEARRVFDNLPVRDVVSWSAMIKGYGMNHEGEMAVQCFEDMQRHGVKPNDVTFTCLLTACSRARMSLKGQEIFNLMREEYGIAPTLEHYTCMVDLLAQSAHLCEAEDLIETMACPSSEETWTALLGACKIYGEPKVGLRCFQQLVQVNPECATPYVLMANIYASGGMWDDAFRVEELRKRAAARKKPASALIEVNKKVHEFVVGNNESKEIKDMLHTLNLRMKEEGHVPNVGLDLRPILVEEKESALCEHAEKLAIAFGLLHTPQGQTLRVTKNLRMCDDCHHASKIISRIEKREIIVRDVYHIHQFKEGLCSCEDTC